MAQQEGASFFIYRPVLNSAGEIAKVDVKDYGYYKGPIQNRGNYDIKFKMFQQEKIMGVGMVPPGFAVGFVFSYEHEHFIKKKVPLFVGPSGVNEETYTEAFAIVCEAYEKGGHTLTSPVINRKLQAEKQAYEDYAQYDTPLPKNIGGAVLKKTKEKVHVAGRERIVYTGVRRKKFVKVLGEFVAVTKLKKGI